MKLPAGTCLVPKISLQAGKTWIKKDKSGYRALVFGFAQRNGSAYAYFEADCLDHYNSLPLTQFLTAYRLLEKGDTPFTNRELQEIRGGDPNQAGKSSE